MNANQYLKYWLNNEELFRTLYEPSKHTDILFIYEPSDNYSWGTINFKQQRFYKSKSDYCWVMERDLQYIKLKYCI